MIEDKLKNFISDNKNVVLSRLKSTDDNYRQLVDVRTQYSKKVFAQTCNDTALNNLIQDYTSCMHEIQDIETDILYIQGVKDCFEFLRQINIL